MTHVFGDSDTAAINLVIVSSDPQRDDSYGRQIERKSSVPPCSVNSAGGYCWKPA